MKTTKIYKLTWKLKNSETANDLYYKKLSSAIDMVCYFQTTAATTRKDYQKTENQITSSMEEHRFYNTYISKPEINVGHISISEVTVN